jgi:ferredoxin-nitrite reductase
MMTMALALSCAGAALLPGHGVIMPAARGGMSRRAAMMADVEQKKGPIEWLKTLFKQDDDVQLVSLTEVEVDGEPQVQEVELTPLMHPRKTMSIPKARTGTSYLPAETIERAEKGSKFEKIKLEKDTTTMFTDLYDYAAKIRSGELDWQEVEDADVNTRFKWLGMLHRAKRAPGSFMMRLRVINGIVTSEQMRFYADSVEPFGPEQGVIDITTRQNIQIRGLTVDAAADVIDGLHALNQTCIQTGFDNIRNMVGNPLAGIDENEMVDTRPFCNMLNDLVTLDEATGQRGNPVYCNLPRKFNICVSGNRDDYAHTHINDIGFVPTPHATTGEMGFNVVFGGYMSIKRVAESIPCDIWIPANLEASRALAQGVLRIFRDEGDRSDRQKARLMWVIERYGVPAFRAKLLREPALAGIRVEQAQPEPTTPYERRELLGVHKQPNGQYRVGIHVPAGRLSVHEARQIADLSERYSSGEIRLTVEQNAMLPNVDEAKLSALLGEPALTGDSRMSVEPGHIVGHTVSCTGSQFCGLAMIETKASAERIATKLDELITVPRPLRIHWTGCPNSCGQVQVADIGLMGGPAKKLDEASGKMKAVPGVSIFVGGKVGEHAFLALEPYKTKVPMADEDLLPELVAIAKEHFGAVDK